jgi:hypothetical protein
MAETSDPRVKRHSVFFAPDGLTTDELRQHAAQRFPGLIG